MTETSKQATPSSENTSKAYAADWRHFARWCRLNGVEPLPPAPPIVAQYLADLAKPSGGTPALQSTSIRRRLSGLVWNYAQRGLTLDRAAPEITAVLDTLRRAEATPKRKDPIRPDEILMMTATLPFDLRGLRDRALLLIGYVGGLSRSEIVGLDLGDARGPAATGWITILEGGAVLTHATRTGWREVEIGRGSGEQSCPVHALEQWLHFAKIQSGPVFVRTSRNGKRALETRLNDKHVARLIKQTALAAGLRPELSEKDRMALFSGHSLRSGLAHAAKVDRTVGVNATGVTSAEMTRPSEDNRVRFQVNLTKAAGL
ncbi:integrase [Shimia sp. R9_1]|uniref:integrase n=1 Tax=Shimia sp. R9_1 TaxID=2821111 RepID=UPI001AD9C11C|nr:integrase [Shimia sp. R9_1]